MLKHFNYTKDSGDESTRVVFPLNIIDFDGPDEKLFCIDLTQFTDKERAEAEIFLGELQNIMKNAINNAGLASNYRSFFRRGINK